jgi:hypothetical protein
MNVLLYCSDIALLQVECMLRAECDTCENLAC